MASFEDEEVPSLVNLEVLEKKTIPVTILTGFLGSGKTTLLNYLLTQPHGKRIAIIENEFSAGLGIENMIAKSGLNGDSISGFFELNNGCICCSVKEDLLLTLEQLVLHADRFDYILIETTGPIISSLWTDDDLDTSLRLDAVVTVVDTPNITSYLHNPDTATDVTHQIAYADRILLNKIDLVKEEAVVIAESAVRAINPSAKLVPTSFSTIDPDWIFNSNSYSTAALPDIAASLAPAQHTHDEHCSSDCSVSHSAKTLTSCGINFAGDCDLHKLNILLDRILYSHINAQAHTTNSSSDTANDSNVIYRMKGILHIRDHDALHIMQAVHDVFDIQASSHTRGSAGDTTNGMNKVIVIGKNIDSAYLEKELMSCVEK